MNNLIKSSHIRAEATVGVAAVGNFAPSSALLD
jgi:hypothetical protein